MNISSTSAPWLLGTALALIVAIVALILALAASRRARRLQQNLQSSDLDVPRLLELAQDLETFRSTLRNAVQGIGLVRFDAFPGSGGQFSFALALLDGQSNGIVVTALSGREETRVYAKQLNQGHCDQPLSPEETRALDEALGRHAS